MFCAGLDLDIIRGKRAIETRGFLERLYFALNDIQYRMGKPTIAAVDGAARAGGMTIAISCDMVIAGDAATFGYPEIDVGLIPAMHFVQLPRLVGKHQAFGPLFLGDPFDAATAFRMGLFSEVVPKGTALERARAIAQRLAAEVAVVMKIGRDAFMRAVDADYRRAVENAAESFALVAEHRRLSGRTECFRREAAAEIYRTLTRIARQTNTLKGETMAGLYFEEFEVGREYHHEFSRTVTEMDNTMFSLLTMNPQPLHLDAHFSENTEFGQRLFNSLYTLGIMIGMSVYDTTLGTTDRQSRHDRRQVPEAGVSRRHAEGAYQNHFQAHQPSRGRRKASSNSSTPRPTSAARWWRAAAAPA